MDYDTIMIKFNGGKCKSLSNVIEDYNKLVTTKQRLQYECDWFTLKLYKSNQNYKISKIVSFSFIAVAILELMAIVFSI